MTTRRNYYGDPTIIKMAPGESATVSATTSATAMASLTIPANTLRKGDTIVGRVLTEADAVNSTNTHQVVVKITPAGGTATVLSTGAAVNATAGQTDLTEFEVDVLAVGAAGTGSVYGRGEAQWSTSAAVLTPTDVQDATNFDTTVDNVVTAFAVQSASSAGNQTSVKTMRLEIIPATQ